MKTITIFILLSSFLLQYRAFNTILLEPVINKKCQKNNSIRFSINKLYNLFLNGYEFFENVFYSVLYKDRNNENYSEEFIIKDIKESGQIYKLSVYYVMYFFWNHYLIPNVINPISTNKNNFSVHMYIEIDEEQKIKEKFFNFNFELENNSFPILKKSIQNNKLNVIFEGNCYSMQDSKILLKLPKSFNLNAFKNLKNNDCSVQINNVSTKCIYKEIINDYVLEIDANLNQENQIILEIDDMYIDNSSNELNFKFEMIHNTLNEIYVEQNIEFTNLQSNFNKLVKSKINIIKSDINSGFLLQGKTINPIKNGKFWINFEKINQNIDESKIQIFESGKLWNNYNFKISGKNIEIFDINWNQNKNFQISIVNLFLTQDEMKLIDFKLLQNNKVLIKNEDNHLVYEDNEIIDVSILLEYLNPIIKNNNFNLINLEKLLIIINWIFLLLIGSFIFYLLMFQNNKLIKTNLVKLAVSFTFGIMILNYIIFISIITKYFFVTYFILNSLLNIYFHKIYNNQKTNSKLFILSFFLGFIHNNFIEINFFQMIKNELKIENKIINLKIKINKINFLLNFYVIIFFTLLYLIIGLNTIELQIIIAVMIILLGIYFDNLYISKFSTQLKIENNEEENKINLKIEK